MNPKKQAPWSKKNNPQESEPNQPVQRKALKARFKCPECGSEFFYKTDANNCCAPEVPEISNTERLDREGLDLDFEDG